MRSGEFFRTFCQFCTYTRTYIAVDGLVNFSLDLRSIDCSICRANSCSRWFFFFLRTMNDRDQLCDRVFVWFFCCCGGIFVSGKARFGDVAVFVRLRRFFSGLTKPSFEWRKSVYFYFILFVKFSALLYGCDNLTNYLYIIYIYLLYWYKFWFSSNFRFVFDKVTIIFSYLLNDKNSNFIYIYI